ncbi:hypothetical protein FHX78_116236 [Streptomyces capillispiralis]|uniref:Uncharacterized protein n=1 Tax=Streptomyces capillispiralis TaxID=68182 RepID=A0A561TQ00_9ACTN|nr:hypothetical protein FHX78_116236 [Streptomyces capillispiralis]
MRLALADQVQCEQPGLDTYDGILGVIDGGLSFDERVA